MKTYLNLFKLELKLFFSRKNIVTIIGGAIVVAVFCYCYFMPKYDSYYAELQHSFEVQLTYGDIQSKFDEDNLETIENSKKDKKQLEEDLGYSAERLKYILACWDAYIQDLQKANYFVKPDIMNLDTASQIINRMDYQRDSYTKYKKDLFKQHFYGDKYEDFKKDVAVHRAYEKAGKKELMNKATPTGSYMFIKTFSGDGFIIMAFVIFLFMINYDAWCNEFENGTYAQTFTLPYERKSIIIIRWVSRVLFTCALIIAYTLEILAIGTIKFGTGFDEYVAFRKDGKYICMLQKTMMAKNLIYLLVLTVFIVTFIMFMSVLLKSSINALTVIFFCVSLYAMRNVDYSKFNPYTLFKMSPMMTNESVLGIRLAIALCIFYSVILLAGMTTILMKREE